MINPYCFTDRALQVISNISLDSHHINHSNSKLTIQPNFSKIGIELRHISKILNGMAAIYAGLTNQKKLYINQCFQQKMIEKLKIIKCCMELSYK